MMEAFSTQLIVDADDGQHGWEVVLRFDRDDCEAAWTGLTDQQLTELAPRIGEAIVKAVLRERAAARSIAEGAARVLDPVKGPE